MHGSTNLKKVVKKARCSHMGTVGHVAHVVMYGVARSVWVALHDINQFVLIIISVMYNSLIALQVLYTYVADRPLLQLLLCSCSYQYCIAVVDDCALFGM